MMALVFQMIACAFMTGLIWIIQLLHYPSFSLIEPIHFKEFHRFHTKKISLLVIPAMILELVTGIHLYWVNQNEKLLQLNLLLLLFLWAATFLISVPLHNKLSKNRDEQTIKKLVDTNWIRTILWSLRLLLLCVYFLESYIVSK